MASSRQTRIRSDRYNSNITKRGLVTTHTTDVSFLKKELWWIFFTIMLSFPSETRDYYARGFSCLDRVLVLCFGRKVSLHFVSVFLSLTKFILLYSSVFQIIRNAQSGPIF